MDSLVQCASYLDLHDLSNMAMSSKYLQRAAYSDSIWQSFFRQQWSPVVPSGFPQTSTAREAYLSRRTDLMQFKFVDPLVIDFPTEAKPHENLHLEQDTILFSQGSSVHVLNINNFLNGRDPYVTLRDHTARITSMRHKTSLLVSISRNSKNSGQVMVWDTATSSAVRSSCCVGKSTLPGAPKAMKCHESLIYAAAGSSVVAIDIRTMRQVFKVNHQEELHSFQMLPEKSLICTGLAQRAMLWDVRRGCDIQQGEAVAELDGHIGNVNLLHMDPYKIVSGGQEDFQVHVWETGNGRRASSLIFCRQCDSHRGFGCSAMAVNGCRIVTACNYGDHSALGFQDFNNAMVPISSNSTVLQSKFWGPQSQSDTEEESDNDSTELPP
ncbi:uncharacterized protein LOC132047119 isoform X2 [Lycium ferocissimum]|uniref:uncharacterized protein LOC132047119 isoform X2 n=1 Tax=Lycium ferocissimum TaxID=112874 RepID=UPI0028161F4D|nr:uncharacterized protein LOC132047119 isoform X2 [Lycium ferocissimum]